MLSSSRKLEADVVIVGAGSAGCTLAARLSENSDLRVLLLEAGSESKNPWIDIPLGYAKTVGDPRHDWRFETEPESSLAGRKIPFPRGKGIGGTGLINGMLYLRGHQNDYNQWAALGNRGWDWESVLPYFERSLHHGGAGRGAQDSGRLWVSRLPRDILSDAFVNAALRCGIPRTDDFNHGDNLGVGYFDMTTRRGRRMSSAHAFLKPVLNRKNLTVVSEAHATRVVIESGHATGVEFIRQGVREIAYAAKEVILCAGAIQSPHLLQLSGIGNPSLLKRYGIPVVKALPGVGQNLQDHLQLRPTFRCKDVETLNEIAHSHWRGAREMIRYLMTRGGALNGGVFRAGAFFNAGRDVGWPDTQIHFGLVSFDERRQPPHKFPGITVSTCTLRPESRGCVELRSSDPLVPPAISPNYLSSSTDQELAIAAFRKVRELVRSPELARYVVAEHEPGPAVQSDAEILTWAQRRASSIFHPVGTCSMGPDDDANAVVDDQLRVRGVDGLRVVDGSIMPRLVSGNTNSPIIMIAERAADLISGNQTRRAHAKLNVAANSV